MEQEFLTQPSKPTFSLQALLPPLPVKKTKTLRPRQELINRICYELGISNKDRSGLFMQTSTSVMFTDNELIALKEKALTWKTGNPAAWFRSMVKQRRLEIKKTLQ